MVSLGSIVFMVFSLLISLALTFGLFFFLRKKYGLKLIPVLVGAAAFLLFVIVLEASLHSLVLQRAPDGSIALMANPLLYVLYGAFAAGIFEETARFLSFKLLKRKYTGVSTALSYGIGHGGAEVLLLVTLVMINNIALSIIINMGNLPSIVTKTPQIASAIEQLTAAAPWLFAVGGIERIFAMAVQISLSVIVWHSVNSSGKVWFYPLAIVLHAVVDVAPTMYQCGVITNVLLVEIITALLAAALVIFIIRAKLFCPAKVTEIQMPEKTLESEDELSSN